MLFREQAGMREGRIGWEGERERGREEKKDFQKTAKRERERER